MTDGGAPGRRDRSGYRLAVVLLAAGAALLVLAYGRTWSTTTAGGSGLPTVTVALSGSDLSPVGTAIALLSLAGIAGLVAARRRGRLIVGVLLVAGGLLATWASLSFGLTWSSSGGAGEAIRTAVAERAAVELEGARTSVSAWWVVGALGGLSVVAGGALAVLRSRRWPELGRRYERGEGRERRRAPATPSAWDQLDQGIDPTERPVHDTSSDPRLRPDDEA